MVLECVIALPDRRLLRPVEQWAAGHPVDRATALQDTYTYARSTTSRTVWATGVWAAALSIFVGAIAGATGSRLVQYAILGAVVGTGAQLIAFHNILESILRPVRAALAGDTGIGDSLPRPRPTFAGRSNVSVVAVAFVFAVVGASLGAVIDGVAAVPVLAVAIGGALALGLAVPISVGLGFSPSLQPIRDLARGAERVAAGDYSRRLPVVQDDDLGALSASFNRMQAGLAERQRLQAAFGT
jgi:HAMP domain-containing protein